jgi:hypothetical protein
LIRSLGEEYRWRTHTPKSTSTGSEFHPIEEAHYIRRTNHLWSIYRAHVTSHNIRWSSPVSRSCSRPIGMRSKGIIISIVVILMKSKTITAQSVWWSPHSLTQVNSRYLRLILIHKKFEELHKFIQDRCSNLQQITEILNNEENHLNMQNYSDVTKFKELLNYMSLSLMQATKNEIELATKLRDNERKNSNLYIWWILNSLDLQPWLEGVETVREERSAEGAAGHGGRA